MRHAQPSPRLSGPRSALTNHHCLTVKHVFQWSNPVDARLSLVEKLLTSLNLPIDKEAERRVSQIEAGEVKLVPGEEVFSRIQAKNRK